MKAVLVLNAGSSSLKFALYPFEPTLSEHPALSGQVEGIGATPRFSARDALGERFEADVPVQSASQREQHRDSLAFLLAWLARNNPALQIIAAGHRIVHGGQTYSAPVRLDDAVLTKLEAFIPLAPLHQPHNLSAVRAVISVAPEIPQVGCFDTAFHRSQDPLAATYALPRALTAEGVRRYGFHGLSYDYVSRQLDDVLGADTAKGAVVICHLGNGSSMAALRDHKCMTTSMGFTAIEGLVMGTRTGSLDPGVLLYLMEQKNMDAKALTDLLYKQSGLLGVSGISQDMRTLLASETLEAREAVEMFCYRIAREIGSFAAALGGLDAVVFTGGIGENAFQVRERVCELSRWIGVDLDSAANTAKAGGARRIERTGSRVAVAVVPTNEERMIARYTVETLGL